MIAECGAKLFAKPRAQFAKTFLRAGECRGIAKANLGDVAGIITVGDDEINRADGSKKPVEHLIVSAVFVQPDKTMKQARGNPRGRAFYPLPDIEIGALGPLLDAGIVDVANDGDAKSFREHIQIMNAQCRMKN